MWIPCVDNGLAQIQHPWPDAPGMPRSQTAGVVGAECRGSYHDVRSSRGTVILFSTATARAMPVHDGTELPAARGRPRCSLYLKRMGKIMIITVKLSRHWHSQAGR
jgi:hypothetical protein